MKMIYRMRTCGHRMGSRSIPVGEDIPFGWYDSPEVAEVESKKLQENRRNEYKELLPQATEILEQKKLELLEAIGNLDCDVYTSADANDDTGLDSCLTLEISLIGKFGPYSYSSDIQI